LLFDGLFRERGQQLKRKIFSIVFALVLALGLILAMAVPVGAITDHLEMVSQPGDTTAGQTIAGPPQVQAIDAETGDPVPGVDIAVTEIGHVYAFDAGTLTQTTNGEGIATFDDLIINTPNTGYRLHFDATAAGYGTVDSGFFDVVTLDEVWVATTGDDDNPGTEAEPFATIRQGVIAAAEGGTVHVEPGEYDETTITIDRSVTVESVSGNWHDTIIDPAPASVFAFSEYEGDATISGLTIDGSDCDYGIFIGGLHADGSITVSNCHIYGAGIAGIHGAGIDGGLEGDIFIDNCIVGENGWDTGTAGILLAYIHGTVEITDSFIGGYWDGTGDYAPNSNNGIELDEVEVDGSVLIDNNIIADNDNYGIYVPGDTVDGELTITSNIIGAYAYDLTEGDALFTGNGGWGIYIEYVTGDGVVTIEDNKLAENDAGIRIATNQGESTISNNYVGAWTQGATTHNGNTNSGIIIDNTTAGSLLIQGNNISKNGYTGLNVANNDSGAGEVTIDSNTIDDNGTGGYGNYFNNIEYATISNNTITLHTSEEDTYCGIYLLSSSYNTIRDNTINENDFGIYIADNSYYNEVLNNTIQDNNIDGIYIDGDHNYIAGNTISNNQGALLCGVYLGGDAVDNVINYNNITGNTLGGSVGVYNNNESTTVDAENNWWGDASGPYNETGNPEGLGDAVSDYVDYGPWLGQEWSGEVWVDDDYTEETPGWGVFSFASIQDAIYAVPPYTTINVAPGEYFEGPTLEDTGGHSEYDYLADIWICLDGLTLQAENPAAGLEDPEDPTEASVIVASGAAEDAVNINANNVTFDGFTVAGEEGTNCGVDIYDWDEAEFYSDCTVTNNYITGNDYYGIWLEGDRHNISYNIITWNYEGIDIFSTDGSSITIESNEISDADTLIFLEEVADGSSITISNNTLHFCECAIYCGDDSLDGSSVTIEDNTIYDADCDGIEFDLITNGSELTIQHNNIHDNYGGIALNAVVEGSEAAILNNTINGNEDGIYLGAVDGGSTVTIGGNTITNNIAEGDDGGPQSGIDLDEGVDATSVSVHFNNIYGNEPLGISNGGIGTLDARWNWWNTDTGPYNETSYPDGEGDEVSDDVNCDHLLTAPVTGFASQTGASGVDGTAETGGWVNVTGGTADAYIARYGSNPGSAFSGGTGQYIDVMILNSPGVTEIEIRLYYTDAQVAAAGLLESSLRLKWWDGFTWVECSDSGVNTTNIAAPPPAGAPYSGYMWAKIRNETTPGLSELTGTPFGGGGASAGGGGGGGWVGASRKLLNITGMVATPSAIELGADGAIPVSCHLISTDSKLTLDIARGTKLLASGGMVLDTLSVAPQASLPPPPSDAAIILAYDFGTNGATFSPPITMTISYDPAAFPDGVAEKDLYIAYWNGSEWVALDTTVDTLTRTATCQLSHFTTFALIGTITPAPPAEETPQAPQVEETPQAPPAEETPPAPAAVGWWIWVIVGVVVVGLAIFFAVRRRA
jgi:parallel beta-helix repeat protein